MGESVDAFVMMWIIIIIIITIIITIIISIKFIYFSLIIFLDYKTQWHVYKFKSNMYDLCLQIKSLITKKTVQADHQ